MSPLRLRHPGGVTTIQIDIGNATVQDLQQEVYRATNILPSLQDLRTGYPPRSLEIIPELPADSLGLKAGDQLIVNTKAGSVSTAVGGAVASAPPSQPFGTPVPPAAAAPQPRSTPLGRPPKAASPDFVETEGGALIVPDDNSCLFSSVALVFRQDIGKASEMRQLAAEGIRGDPETFNEAILGRSQSEYIATILKPSTWGGAIELSVFAKMFATEIDSVDVETGRIDQFTPPPETNTGNRCILIYSGIHYDAASLAPAPDAPGEFHQTVFPVIASGDSDPILVAAKKLADKLRAKKAYTNTSTFDLKCEVRLRGEKEARAHAAETGHTSFGEY
ncbi:OTU-domain-containing protein [Punctularia strigosozonata HHB-11173 SS5]|uniref:OTU-domain-containing protein n=1 Tax=Punctularia strigosozonata (strain HHB-11173) TaxID=741275 RepID=UPI0004417CF7|nr:OTU-domain-containing protein [Punctularia strigosozonata HHB-11173 SS5]EIN07273.1 OTU-domain-containing protein [Punctularia strigosozonata HHB-11173 SS5]